jgi:hypothetical protein
MAPAHIKHGSNVTYKSQPSNLQLPMTRRLPALLQFQHVKLFVVFAHDDYGRTLMN